MTAGFLTLLLALTPAEDHGRDLFSNGIAVSGEAVPVTVGDVTMSVAMPCAGCHGVDGGGGGEGGIRAPAITWEALSHRATNPGRRRQAYDARRLVRAIAMGRDSDGHALASTMPRYQLQREDADNLAAFLQRLGTLRDRGIGERTLTIGVLLPSDRSGDVLRVTAAAWAREVNARGGIYARQLSLRFMERPSPADVPFAFLGWGDDEVARWMAQHQVPFIRVAGGNETASPFVFDLGPSLASEVDRLVAFATEEREVPILLSRSSSTPLPASVLASPSLAACTVPRCRTDEAASARAVLCLDATCLRAVPASALALVPSSLGERAVATLKGDAIIAAVAVPSDIDPGAAAAYHLEPVQLADKWGLLAAGRLLVHALSRAGADLSRASFAATLRSTRHLKTGFSPPLSFDADCFRGTEVVRLLRFDAAKRTLTPLY